MSALQPHVAGRQSRPILLPFGSLVRIDVGKANRAPPGTATWIKLESQSLGNESDDEPADFVGVASLWQKPDPFDGLSARHLYQVQLAVAEHGWRENVQAADWVGKAVARVTGMSVEEDKVRIKALLRTWIRNGALKIEHRADGKGNPRPFVVVGDWVDPNQFANPHPAR